jgi:GntR family transcriptional regulator / MocR family aminotransferase
MGTDNDILLKKIVSDYQRLKAASTLAKYTILYQVLKDLILKNYLQKDAQLPSTRNLAKRLDLSRTTIFKALDLLLLEKRIQSKIGGFYSVIGREAINNIPERIINPNDYPKISDLALSFSKHTPLTTKSEDPFVAFKPGLPPIDIFPIRTWKHLINGYWRYVKTSDLSLTHATYSENLKIQLAQYLKICRNLHCRPEQIFIVSGSLQSIYLIGTALLNSGDLVHIENPSFPNVKTLLHSFNAQINPLTLDAEGAMIPHLLNTQQQKSPQFVHLTPSNQYPLGIQMSESRKLGWLQWAKIQKSYLIENEYEFEINHMNDTSQSLFSLDSEDRVFHLGTFNRLLYPSIRFGYMVVPNHLIRIFESIQHHSHRIVPHSMQWVMTEFIKRNHLYQHLQKLQETVKERNHTFLHALEPFNVGFQSTPSKHQSMHKTLIWNHYKSLQEEHALMEQLKTKDISVHSIQSTFEKKAPISGFILGHTVVPTSVMKQKVKEIIDLTSKSNHCQ